MTAAQLLEFAPQLGCLSQDELALLITRAECRVDEDYFGDIYEYALRLMAAHMGTMQTQASGAAPGTARRKKAGDLEVEYETSASANVPSQYAGTRYGVELWGLIQELSYKASFTVI